MAKPELMQNTIEEIKALLAKAGPLENCGTPIATGTLVSLGGQAIEYRLLVGWDVALANVCDEAWGVFNIQLMRYIREQDFNPSALQAALNKIQIDDSHWRWLNKSVVCRGDEYRWFFMIAEGYPQAACLTYHPKPSAIDGQGIFYIEYLAVAPWNRENPMCERSFKGIGKIMINEISAYATAHLGLRPGFSLHALPRAIGFYQSIGMERIPAFDKDSLPYFEMPALGNLGAPLAV